MLTSNEVKVLTHILEHGEIPSSRLKEIFNIQKGRVLTKKNFPNVRSKLHSHMTANSRGMYRGGFAWFSAVTWKGPLKDLERMLESG